MSRVISFAEDAYLLKASKATYEELVPSRPSDASGRWISIMST